MTDTILATIALALALLALVVTSIDNKHKYGRYFPPGPSRSRKAFKGTMKLTAFLHSRFLHPDYEYEVTRGPRKAWMDAGTPPEGEGWERNVDAGHPGEGWERFEFHEESYWRRRRP